MLRYLRSFSIDEAPHDPRFEGEYQEGAAASMLAATACRQGLYDLFQKSGRLHAFFFGVQDMGIKPQGMRQLGVGVNAG
jgi:hypothetical protein